MTGLPPPRAHLRAEQAGDGEGNRARYDCSRTPTKRASTSVAGASSSRGHLAGLPSRHRAAVPEPLRPAPIGSPATPAPPRTSGMHFPRTSRDRRASRPLRMADGLVGDAGILRARYPRMSVEQTPRPLAHTSSALPRPPACPVFSPTHRQCRPSRRDAPLASWRPNAGVVLAVIWTPSCATP